jgi:hypothetical protein
MKQKENISYPVNQFIDDMVKFIHLQLYIFKLKQQYYLFTVSEARSIPHHDTLNFTSKLILIPC